MSVIHKFHTKKGQQKKHIWGTVTPPMETIRQGIPIQLTLYRDKNYSETMILVGSRYHVLFMSSYTIQVLSSGANTWYPHTPWHTNVPGSVPNI